MMRLLPRLFFLALWPFLAQAAQWQMEKSLVLKKDEPAEIVVKTEGVERLLLLRWTLYKNGGLVVIRHFEGFPGHHMLYLRNKNRSFRVDLLPPGEGHANVPYLLVKFEDFDTQLQQAHFGLFLRDPKGETLLKIGKEKE